MINNARCRPGLLFSIMLTVLLIGLIPGTIEAADPEYFMFEPKNKIEVSASFDRLSPNETYGDWKNLSLSYYHRQTPDLTWFASANNFARKEGNGVLGAVGAYMDWTDSFFTFTSVSGGSNTSYLPKIRIDQDLDFKFGGKKNLVWTIGGSYIKYHGETRDYIWSTGLTAYLDKSVVSYRLFRTRANPGSVVSNSHQFSIALGVDKHEVTTLLYSFGNQAYMASYQTDPQLVDNDARTIRLNHRQWVTRDQGYFADISRTRVDGGYTSVGVGVGYFWEY